MCGLFPSTVENDEDIKSGNVENYRDEGDIEGSGISYDTRQSS